MKKLIAVTFFALLSVSAVFAQQPSKAVVQAAMKKFPGVSTAQMEQMIQGVLTFIRDIDQPNAGIIVVDQGSMLRLKDRLDAAVR